MACPDGPTWYHVSARPKEIWLPANTAIELAYRAAKPTNTILMGSDFITGTDIRLGSSRQAFGNKLLSELRGTVRLKPLPRTPLRHTAADDESEQLRPDIIDFTERTFYEIKTERNALAEPAKVKGQLAHYYQLSEAIRRSYGGASEPEWSSSNAQWKPPELLPFPGDKNMVVCTAATNYQIWPPGLVLYEVLRKNDKAEQALKQLADARDDLARKLSRDSEEHAAQLALYNGNIFGFWTNRTFNRVPPQTIIWTQAQVWLLRVRNSLDQQSIARASAELEVARAYYLWALQQYVSWKDGIEGAGRTMQVAIAASALALGGVAVSGYFLAAGEAGAVATSDLHAAARIQQICGEAIRLLSSRAGSAASALELINKAASATTAITN